MESWSIKSRHVCLNFINSGLSFFAWIFSSFKPQNAVLRNTGLGSVENIAQSQIGGFGRIALGGKAPSLPGALSYDKRPSRATGHQLLCARLAAVPSLQGMDGVVSDSPPAQEPGSLHRKPLHDGLKETPINSSGKVTGGTC